jgi:hypothetical protein
MPQKGKKISKEYSSNVFINCPFDLEYKEIFNAIIFTIVDCGFIPRCAIEKDGSEDVRIDKIIALMEDCKYAIHDICRV